MENFLQKELVRAFKRFCDKNCVEYIDGEVVESLSYFEVQNLVRKIDHCLSKGSNVVGIAFDLDSRNIVGYPVAIFAAVSMQKPFFIIDSSNHTWKWISETMRELEITCIIAKKGFQELLSEQTMIEVVSSSYVCEKFLEIEVLNLSLKSGAFVIPFPDLTYLVQTSGTSGRRKTVMVSERSIKANIEDFVANVQLENEKKIFAAAPPTFDPFYVDVFLSAFTGCCLLLVPQHVKASPKTLSHILFDTNKLSYLQITPSLYRLLSDAIHEIILSDQNFLRQIILGGEEFPQNIPSEVLSSHLTSFYNVYGVTEMSCWQSLVIDSHFNPFYKFHNIFQHLDPCRSTQSSNLFIQESFIAVT